MSKRHVTQEFEVVCTDGARYYARTLDDAKEMCARFDRTVDGRDGCSGPHVVEHREVITTTGPWIPLPISHTGGGSR